MDAAILLEAVSGADKNDSKCSPQVNPGPVNLKRVLGFRVLLREATVASTNSLR
jgi:hypothetical protein